MKKIFTRILFYFIAVSFLFLDCTAQQVAPVTTAGDISGCQGIPCVSIPVTVTGFIGITALSLRMEFNAANITFCSCTNVNPLLAGFITGPPTLVSGTVYRLMASWASVNPLTLAEESKLFDVQFTLVYGNDSLIFNNSSNGGSDCEYADSTGNVLPDEPTPTFYHNSTVTIYPNPVPTISGPSSVCVNSTGNIYVTESGMNGYAWSIAGGTITAGAGTNVITVTWNAAGSQSVSVSYNSSQGCPALSPTSYPVTVYMIPETPTITFDEYNLLLVSNAPDGNQWYLSGAPIPGATGQTYEPGYSGIYWDIVTLNGCSSDTSNNQIVFLGISNNSLSPQSSLFPDPNDGQFTLKITTYKREMFTFMVFNELGIKIFEQQDFEVIGEIEKSFDLRPVSKGIYLLLLLGTDGKIAGYTMVVK